MDRFVERGFAWIWFLSIWQTGAAGQHISRDNPEWRGEFEQTLPDLRDADIAGSGFAISSYVVHRQLGGDAALGRLRERLRQRGLRLLLDFVPNHTAPDHPWVENHPEYYISGTVADLEHAPQNYTRIENNSGGLIMTHGRDPYFPGWPDTIQLNYANPATQDAMIAELTRIAKQCDGVRCDMAMLMLPEVFERTWGMRPEPFWPRAIGQVRRAVPDFCFLAEVYWDMEWTLQQQGFDYTYDKRLYDRLVAGDARPVREHLYAGLDYQKKMVRFLENHDEPRAAAAFPAGKQKAAALIAFLSPGLRFFHQGQFEGRLKRISPHLVRAPLEDIDRGIERFYDRLLELLHRPILRDGKWRLLECVAAWEGNSSASAIVAFAWQGFDGQRLLVAVNYSAHSSQGYVRLPFSDIVGNRLKLHDIFGEADYERSGSELQSRGLYLDVTPWEHQVFEITNIP